MNRRWLSIVLAALPVVGVVVRLQPTPRALAAACPASLSGGSVSTVGGDCVLSYTTIGTYSWTPPAGVASVDVLVVAGGGGGGADAAGGGGGGGVIYEQSYPVAGAVSLTVGAGGAGGRNSTSTVASNGANSVFGALTAVGGGRGGTYRGGAGAAGGSGGGGGFDTGAGGGATAGQGNAGAASGRNGWCLCAIPGPAGGGGGGAGGPGTAGNVGDGNGGPGRTVDITGANVVYAGGGGGGRWSVASSIENGGTGGGGRGAGSCGANPSLPGTPNTGGGGGGAPAGCQTFGSNGGSGIVIVRYALPDEIAPSRTGTSLNAAGTQVSVIYDEQISTSVPAASAFTVRVNGNPVTISSVAASGTSIVLGLAVAIWQGATVTVAYSDPSGADDGNAVQDVAGNDAPSFAAVSVVNSSSATTTTTSTTTTTPATTTTVVTQSSPTTAAPALDVVVNAPVSTSPSSTSASESPVTASVPAPSVPPRTAGATTVPPAVAQRTTTTFASTTTLPNNAGGTVAPTPPRVPVVAAGSAGVTVGDESIPATVERLDNQLVVSAGGLRATLGGLDDGGSRLALDKDGNVRLRPGDKVRISLAGFEPESRVQAWLFSTPVLMGETTVGGDGTVVSTFTVPRNAPSGAHRIAVVARTTDGDRATLAVGVMIGEWTGEGNISLWLILFPMVLAVIGALSIPATRRRRRATVAG